MTQRTDPAAALRDYFGDLAQVGPADHQLPDVLGRTAAITQRPAWRARLPRVRWLETPVGQIPARYGLVGLSVVLLVWTLGVIGGGGAARSPFEGHWTSKDIGDGSAQILDVRPGTAPAVRFEDRMATGCSTNGDDSVDFIAHGAGQIAGDRLIVAFPNGGGCHTWQVPAYQVTFTLDRPTGTMRDSDGTIWTRAP